MTETTGKITKTTKFREEITAYDEMRLVASGIGVTNYVDALEWNFRKDNGYERYSYGFNDAKMVMFAINKIKDCKSISIFIQIDDKHSCLIKATYHTDFDYSEVKNIDLDWNNTSEFINAIHETIGKALLASLM